MLEATITDQEFALFQRLIYRIAGISLSDAKKILLVGRLTRRLKQYDFASFTQYYRMLASGEHPEELQTMVDLLTTNETYFFREPKHFDFLRDEIIRKRTSPATFRVWSAASSSGEEIYTLAMVLADNLPNTPWEVVGSDISTQVLAKAASGHYSLARTEGIPPAFMQKYCLKGVRSHAGTFLIAPELRQHTRFYQINLTQPIDAGIGEFDRALGGAAHFVRLPAREIPRTDKGGPPLAAALSGHAGVAACGTGAPAPGELQTVRCGRVRDMRRWREYLGRFPPHRRGPPGLHPRLRHHRQSGRWAAGARDRGLERR